MQRAAEGERTPLSYTREKQPKWIQFTAGLQFASAGEGVGWEGGV